MDAEVFIYYDLRAEIDKQLEFMLDEVARERSKAEMRCGQSVEQEGK